jgi:hypothetical protein
MLGFEVESFWPALEQTNNASVERQDALVVSLCLGHPLLQLGDFSTPRKLTWKPQRPLRSPQRQDILALLTGH